MYHIDNKKNFSELLFLSLLYIITGLFGVSLASLEGSSLIMVWLPSGFGAVMAIRFGYRGVVAVLFSSFVVNVPFYFEDGFIDLLGWLPVSILSCFIDALQSLLVMFFFRRYQKNLIFYELNTPLIRSVLIILLVPTFLTSWMLLLVGDYHFGFLDGTLYTLIKNYIPIFIADTAGVFLILSLFTVFTKWSDFSPLLNAKGLGLLLSLVLIPFLATIHRDFMYLSFISLLLLTYLYHHRGAVLGVFLLNIIIVLLVATGVLTFGNSENINQTYIHTLVFVFSTASIFFLMSVLFSEKEEKAKLLMQQSKMATMGEMINAISHQWKQPLTASYILVDILEDYLVQNRCQDKYVEDKISKIRAQLKQMDSTITDFRDFLKPNDKKVSFKLSVIANEVYKLNEAKLHELGIEFEVHGDMDVEVDGNPNELKQVLLNLYSNACDALEGVKSRDRKLSVYIERSKGLATIRVLDNAGGIDEALLPDKLFDYYTSTKGEKGTGIGLHISKTIVQNKFHGNIYAQNRNNGAEFIIEL